MKRKSTKYDTPDAGGWKNACDDLFLAQFRGLPCEICGEPRVYYNGRMTRSMGHHLLEKGLHRQHRYDKRNIVILCANHHGPYARDISPHSDDTGAVGAFYAWLARNKPGQWHWFEANRTGLFDHSWNYRDKYIELGGEVKGDLIKDQRPSNHAEKIRNAEENNAV